MQQLLLPSTIQFHETGKPHEGRVVIEPLFHGYGTTLGNALRRVLLSSLPGAAVVAVKIKGAPHEFSTLEHIKEDVVEIILNLKQLRLRVFSDEEIRLHLDVKGEKNATAYDIETSAQVEIVNPELHIATLTHKDAHLDMELFVSAGRGYVPVEEQNKKRLELGTIAIDSIFTPVINVGYQVEQMRVGEITNYERLIMTIETDGTITPHKALLEANKILLNHFNLVAGEEPAHNASASEEAVENNPSVAQTVEEDRMHVSDASETTEDEKAMKPRKKSITKKKK